MSVDLLADKYPGISPYAYVANNPIANIDINGDTITPMGFANYSGYNLNRSKGINAGDYILYGGTTDGDKPVWVATLNTKEGYRDDYVMDIWDVKEFRKNSSKYLTTANILDAGFALGGNSNGDLLKATADCWTTENVLIGATILGGSFINRGSGKSVKYATRDKPNVKFPGNNPAKAPDGYEWRGKYGSIPESKSGNYYNPRTKESLRPDLNHPDPIGPHWDYRNSSGSWFRIFPDGKISPK